MICITLKQKSTLSLYPVSIVLAFYHHRKPDTLVLVLPVNPGEDGGLVVLLPEVAAEGADGDQVEALPGRALHLAEGARLGVGAEAPLLVREVAPCEGGN